MSGTITVEDRCMKHTPEYPDGSWLHLVDGKVEIATGYFSKEYPDKPSPYFHSGPPFVFMETAEWPWDFTKEKEQTMIAQSILDNWFTYHAPSPEQLVAYEKLRSDARIFANTINELVPDGPDKTVAIRKLRECTMTANAAIACNQGITREP